MVYRDTSRVGTHEYLRFCELVGAEPHIVVNYSSGTVREAADWVEYCNAPVDTELSDLRAKSGHPAPFNVKYWSFSNRTFSFAGACDNVKSVTDYTLRYRRYVSWHQLL
jgi:alpha-N-arabinofuranosidase